MSITPYWKPAQIEPANPLPQELKEVMNEEYELPPDTYLLVDERDTPYFKGLADATSVGEVKRGALAIIAAIREHGSIKLWVE